MKPMFESWFKKSADLFADGQLELQRIAIVIGVTCLVILGVFNLLAGSYATKLVRLYDQPLSNKELAEIYAVLEETNLANCQVQNGYLLVPEDRVATFHKAIDQGKASPSSLNESLNEALETTSFLESPIVRAERFERALENEARLAIRRIPGISDATVHFDASAKKGIQQQSEMTAVVVIESTNDFESDWTAIRMIQDLLCGFKVGLKPRDITITAPGNLWSHRGELPATAIAQIEKKLFVSQAERQWKNQLQGALKFIPEIDIEVVINANSPSEIATAESVMAQIRIPQQSIEKYAKETNTSQGAIYGTWQSSAYRAIRPMLPESVDDETIQRNFVVSIKPTFDENQANVSSQTIPVWRYVSSLCAFTLALGIAVMAFKGKAPVDPIPSLRIYADPEDVLHGAADPSYEDEHSEQEQQSEFDMAQLQKLVKQNPDGIAKSISDLIDRAG